VVTWDSYANSSYDISGQRYDISGNKIGGEFTINTFTSGQQTSSSVTTDSNGGFTVSWQSDDGTIRGRSFLSASIMDGTSAGDTLNGDAKANVINGYLGNDTINGGAGDDVLNGGAGNDTLVGGQGADEYDFGRSGGQDTINAYDTDGSVDKLVVGTGVGTSQLWFTQSGNDLVMNIVGSSDSVTVQNWYGGANQKLDRIQLANGTYATTSDVEALRSAMSAFNPPPLGQTTLDPTVAQALAPTLAASWH